MSEGENKETIKKKVGINERVSKKEVQEDVAKKRIHILLYSGTPSVKLLSNYSCLIHAKASQLYKTLKYEDNNMQVSFKRLKVISINKMIKNL
jgi:hypothetical protein